MCPFELEYIEEHGRVVQANIWFGLLARMLVKSPQRQCLLRTNYFWLLPIASIWKRAFKVDS